MPAKFTNNASATLAASINASATTIVLSSGFGAFFPTIAGGNFFYGTLFDSSNNLEIVKVTARSGDTLTVQRGQDGSTAQSFNAGSGFALRLVAANLDNFVQLDGAQTITGYKTFSSGIAAGGSGFTGSLTGNVTGNVSGNAGTVTNGVYVVGDQTIAGTKTFATQILLNNEVNLAVKDTGGVTRGLVRINNVNNVLFQNAGDQLMLIRNQSDTATLITLTDSSGNFTAAGNVTANSDIRLKSDIQTITNALEIVKNLRGTAYIKDGKVSIGVIAQEVQPVLPQVVQENSDGYLSVAYGNMVAVLIEAVKELDKKIEAK